jgi:uncharacterized membrane protein YjdF
MSFATTPSGQGREPLILLWWVALIGEESAEAFLGTQGDVWDTQWDMFLALLSRLHDRQLGIRKIDTH